MGYDLAMDKSGINHVYQAAKEAKQNGGDQLTAARKAAEKDGNISSMEESFLSTLEKDPRLLDRIYEDGNDLIIKDFNNLNYQYPPENTEVNKNIAFVDDVQPTKEPTFKEMKNSFNKEFSTENKPYFEPNNPQLLAKLNKIAKALDADPKSKEKLINYAIDMSINVAHPDNEDLEATYAENRTIDFLSVFAKLKEKKPLNQDDIQSIQSFIFFQTEHGRLLHGKDGESGIDGKYGPRTNESLNIFLKEQNIK